VDQAGWQTSHPATSGHRIDLASGRTAAADFGNYQPASIRGRKWHDVNANAVWDADEPAVNGWVIELVDRDGQVTASGTTADVDLDADGRIDPRTESGWYRLAAVQPGRYTVREATLEGWTSSYPEWDLHDVSLISAQQATGADFGNYQPVHVCGRKWHDLNANGRWEAGEPALNGWTVELVDSDGQTIATRVTRDRDVNGDGQIDPATEAGWYCFDDLPPASYIVREQAREGWTAGGPTGREQVVQLGMPRPAAHGDAYTIADHFVDHAGSPGVPGEGSHFHASSRLPVDPVGSSVIGANLAEVGGLFGDEEVRGLTEFDLQAMPLAAEAELSFGVADVSGDFSD
jgi:hypothetical protein